MREKVLNVGGLVSDFSEAEDESFDHSRGIVSRIGLQRVECGLATYLEERPNTGSGDP